MAETEARAVMDGYLRALLERGDFAQFFAPDVLWTTMETGDEIRGRNEVRDLIVALHTQMFDARPEVVRVLTGEGTATLEARFIGTHTGAFGDLPATGRQVNVPYCVVYDISDGAISALRAYFPMAALRAELTGATEVRAAEPQPAPA